MKYPPKTNRFARRGGPIPNDRLNEIDPSWAWAQFEINDSQEWNAARVNHLHRRAGFGITPQQTRQGVELGMEKSTQAVLEGGSDESFARETRILANAVGPRRAAEANVALWLHRMLHTPHQLLEKATLFWHGHFATSAAKVTNPKLMLDQNELLRNHALGKFEPMLQEISRDPAMLIYLDSTTNRKTHPNENYAREVMELFCLGIGNYTEKDIQELARCFTGWEVMREKFRFNANQHDTGDKNVLGQVGPFDGDEAIKIILGQDAAAEFIASKLIRYFMFDAIQIPTQLVAPLAAQLRRTDFEIDSAIELILRSNLFYSDHCIGRKIRSPVEMAIGTMRTLNASGNLYELANSLNEQGQRPLYPPNVKGWDGGKDWINSSTMLSRANLIHQLATSDGTKFKDGDLAGWIEGFRVRGTEQTVEFLLDHLVAVEVPSTAKDGLVELANSHRRDRNRQLQLVIAAIGALPEFHIM